MVVWFQPMRRWEGSARCHMRSLISVGREEKLVPVFEVVMISRGDGFGTLLRYYEVL